MRGQIRASSRDVVDSTPSASAAPQLPQGNGEGRARGAECSVLLRMCTSHPCVSHTLHCGVRSADCSIAMMASWCAPLRSAAAAAAAPFGGQRSIGPQSSAVGPDPVFLPFPRQCAADSSGAGRRAGRRGLRMTSAGWWLASPLHVFCGPGAAVCYYHGSVRSTTVNRSSVRPRESGKDVRASARAQQRPARAAVLLWFSCHARQGGRGDCRVLLACCSLFRIKGRRTRGARATAPAPMGESAGATQAGPALMPPLQVNTGPANCGSVQLQLRLRAMSCRSSLPS